MARPSAPKYPSMHNPLGGMGRSDDAWDQDHSLPRRVLNEILNESGEAANRKAPMTSRITRAPCSPLRSGLRVGPRGTSKYGPVTTLSDDDGLNAMRTRGL